MKQIFSFFILACSLVAALGFNPDQPAIEPGKLAVKIKAEYRNALSKSGTGLTVLDETVRRLGIYEIKPRFRLDSRKAGGSEAELWYELHFPLSTDPLAILNSLGQSPFLSHAEPVFIDSSFATPNDPYFPTSLNYPFMEAEAAWDIHKGQQGSQDVIIAIVDTGTNWTHPDLAENIWNNLGEDANANGYTMFYNGSAWVMDPGDLNGIDDDANGKTDDLIGWDFKLNSGDAEANNPSDAGSHGTVVSGLAAGRTDNGIGISSLSWNLTLMPISCSYPAEAGYIFRGYDGIIYAAENGADVINCSWGGTAYSQAAKDAVDYASALGAIIVAAAGNSNNSIPLYPAAYPKVLATAALLNDGTKWSGSNYGGYIDVGAPNQQVYSTAGSGYALISGTTSYASPIASALVGLVKSYHPDWTNQQVINQVKATCTDIDFMNPGKANLLGEGRLNAYQALSAIDPVVDQELRLALFEIRSPNDSNANHAIEPGETFSFNLIMRNYAWNVGATNGSFTLSSSNPNVTINTNSFTRDIPADEFFSLSNAFSVTVSPTAASQYVTFSLTSSAELSIVTGAVITFQVLIQNGGIFVWEGVSGSRDQSGTYIRDRLLSSGYSVVYGTAFPASFFSFDAVFLSFGGLNSNVVRFDKLSMFEAVRDYLRGGGRLYMEGADAIGYDPANFFPNVEGNLNGHEVLWPLLGILSADDGADNNIDLLSGQTPVFGDLAFNSTLQTDIRSIDRFEPALPGGQTAFIENAYGNVGIASAGAFGQRSVVLAYALRELADSSFPSTRANLLDRVMLFFEDENVTLPVELSSFTAVFNGNPVLSWTTASETGSLGFNVYRNLRGELSSATKVNHLLIPAAGNSSQPISYSYTDDWDQSGSEVWYWLEFLSQNGSSQFSQALRLSIPDPEDPENPPPVQYITQLSRVYPNPFSLGINIRYQLGIKADINFEIYNLRGQLIRKLSYASREAGWHQGFWDGKAEDGSDPGEGLYILRMHTPQGTFQKKLIRL